MGKFTRQQAMCEVIDALCPVGALTFDQAETLAAVCEAVALLYEGGGAVYGSGLGLTVKPTAMKRDFWKATEVRSERYIDDPRGPDGDPDRKRKDRTAGD